VKLNSRSFRHETRKYYDSLAADFLKLRHNYGASRRLEAILTLCKAFQKGNALDGGAADGFVMAGLLQQGWSGVALDVSTELLKLGRKRRVDVVAGDLENMPFGESSFLLVVCAEVFEHLANFTDAIRELSRVVSDGGHVVVTIPNPVWEVAFKISDFLRIKVPEKTKRFVTSSWINASMKESGFESVKEQGIILWPFSEPRFARKISRLLESRFPHACATTIMLFRKQEHSKVRNGPTKHR
jgi:ubiquinone/menaquinone biosynthesis C-methylase UbiE